MSSTSFDAISVRDRQITRLRSKIDWARILDSSTAQQLIDPTSEEIAYLAAYKTYLTRENTWRLARNKTSLLAFSPIHRYNAHRKIGAEGTLTLSADETFNLEPSVNIDIPKYSQFSTDDGIIFVSKNAYTLTTNDKYITINVIQGTPRSFSYIASGDDFEEISLNSTTIENSFYEIYVNDVLWTEIDNILEASYDDTKYEIENKIDFSGIYIKFGNNINGKKLESGDTILFKYLDTDGINGNVETSLTVTNVDSTILDINGNSVDIYCKNTAVMVGGKNEETLEEIRTNAPKFFQTGDRASNNDDYETILINNFSYILKVIVWGTYENNRDAGRNPWTNVELEDNNVFIATIRSDGNESLSNAQQLEISQRLNEYKAPTDIVQFNTARKIFLVFTISAYVSDKTYTINEVKGNIDTDLTTNYSYTNREFFQHIRKSDYIRIIDEVSGVDYHHTSIKFYDDYAWSAAFSVSFLASTPTTPSNEIPMYPISTSSIEIYLDVYDSNILTNGELDTSLINSATLNSTTKIGTDDGNGNWTGEAGYTLAGNINYSTGVGALVWSNPTGDYNKQRLRIYHTTSENDLVLNQRYQIFDYDSTKSLENITVAYTEDAE